MAGDPRRPDGETHGRGGRGAGGVRPLRRVQFPDGGLLEVWNRDDPYQNTWLYYLDRTDGEHRVLPNPNDVEVGAAICQDWRSERAVIESSPNRFVEVPMLSHQDHHEIFAAFMKTLPDEVRGLNRPSHRLSGVGPEGRAYSIGGFLEEAEAGFPDLNVRDRWHQCRDAALAERARAWYESHGFDF